MGLLLKILLTLLVILVIWWVVKFRGRVSVLKAAIAAAKKVADDEKAASQKAGVQKTGVPVEMRPCPKCGTFIAAGQPCTCTA